jgi:hypothetical protein
MRIYFAGSIRGGASNREIYFVLVNCLKEFGIVLTEHLPHADEMDVSDLSDKEIFERAVAWIKSSDLLVAEVSNPSLGVGYEICKAEAFKVPTLCLYQKGSKRRLSATIEGNNYCNVRRYSKVEEALGFIKGFINELN